MALSGVRASWFIVAMRSDLASERRRASSARTRPVASIMTPDTPVTAPSGPCCGWQVRSMKLPLWATRITPENGSPATAARSRSTISGACSKHSSTGFPGGQQRVDSEHLALGF